MKSFRPSLPRFKKKIAVLLREALAESRAFDSAHADEVERGKAARKDAQDTGVAVPCEVKIFPPNTDEFESALASVSKGLLDVLRSQFGCTPVSFVKGGITEIDKARSDFSTSVEDNSVLRVFEEEDEE